MSEPKFTIGSWAATPASSVVGSLITSKGINIAAAMPQKTMEETIANARLIASAPDLLTALKEAEGGYAYMLEFCNWSMFPLLREAWEQTHNHLKTAIAQAEGRDIGNTSAA